MFITCPKCSVKYKIPSEISFNAGKKLQCSACQHVFKFFPENLEQETKKEDLVPPTDAVLTITERTKRIVIQEEKQDKKETSLPEEFCPVKTSVSQNKPPYFLIFVCVVVLIFLGLFGWLFRDLLWLDAMPPLRQTHFVNYPRKKAVRKEVVKVEKETVDTSSDIPLTFESEPQPQTTPLEPAVLESVDSEPVISEPLFSDAHENQGALSVGSVRFRKAETGDAFLLEGVLKNTTQEAIELPEKVRAVAYGSEGTVLFEKEIYLPKGTVQPGMEQAFFGTYAPIKEGVQWVDVVLKD